MAKPRSIDFILLGPAHPYRGGIADTQTSLAKALIDLGYSVELWTFSHLYPALLFPGKTQFSGEKQVYNLPISRKVHAYNPLQWKSIAREINTKQPQAVLFRYWTPFLAPCWNSIAKRLNPSIKKIALVDNWVPHESKPWDNYLTKRFERHMDAFTTLSIAIAATIKKQSKKPVRGMYHPIPMGLPEKKTKEVACKKLNLNPAANYILFFGLIRPYKGLDLLLEAMKQHKDKQLLIVGECYENEGKYLSLINSLKLEKQVQYINRFVTLEEAAYYFSVADALVLPYKTATQSGVVALAYHFETPMVVTNHKGLIAPISKDVTGVITAINATAIANGITELYANNNIDRFKENLLQTKANYAWETYAQEWVNFTLNETTQH